MESYKFFFHFLTVCLLILSLSRDNSVTSHPIESDSALVPSKGNHSSNEDYCNISDTIKTENSTNETGNNTSITYSYADLPVVDGKVILSNEEWKKRLTREQYEITRESETEQAFKGKLMYCKKNGTYLCVCCGQELYSSDAKFESESGWPAFFEPINNEALTKLPDTSAGMNRTEVKCSRCDAHLGHVFDDGPKPTRQRYCINSASLKFVESKKKSEPKL